jgi:hypothetical protein
MDLLSTAILEMLAAASAPLRLSMLLMWTHTRIQTTAFSFDQFQDAVCNLKNTNQIVEDKEGFRLHDERDESARSLAELGL